jgi:NitT/TauT family transport system ATP-binding protein
MILSVLILVAGMSLTAQGTENVPLSIQVTPGFLRLHIGDTAQLFPTVLPVEADRTLFYQSENFETLAIKDLSFTVNDGEFLSIIGPSGCGKTSILSLIAGLITPSSGKILYLGDEIKKASGNVGYMLQRDELFPWRTIEKNVLLPLEIKKLNNPQYKNKALSLIEKYALNDFLKSYPNSLSGGMRQRVALIRTLASMPSLLLLDEPFSALDYQTRLSVCDDVYNIIRQEKKTTLLVTHDITEAISMSDRIIVLTNRPAKVKSVHQITLDATSPLKRRERAEFSKWFEIIYKELHQ